MAFPEKSIRDSLPLGLELCQWKHSRLRTDLRSMRQIQDLRKALTMLSSAPVTLQKGDTFLEGTPLCKMLVLLRASRKLVSALGSC